MRKMLACFRVKKDRGTEKKAAVMINGRILLEKSIAFNNGRGNPIRCFSVEDLNHASNNYDQKQAFYVDEFYILYNCFLQGRQIIVKKNGGKGLYEKNISEIVLASQMSSHKNVLKLLGYCLETEPPMLVFESAENGTLHDHIYNTQAPGFRPLKWKDRLKIAVGTSNAIAYVHTAFPRPIIHMDIKPSNILLDQDYVPKLTDFFSSMPIPEGESRIEHRLQTENVPIEVLRFLAPEFFSKSTISEKVDVYSFGVVLLTLLTGRKAQDAFLPAAAALENYSLVDGVKLSMKSKRFIEVIADPLILEEGPWPGKEKQLQDFALLALQCTCDLEDNRPTITEVAKQLRQIYLSATSNI